VTARAGGTRTARFAGTVTVLADIVVKVIIILTGGAVINVFPIASQTIYITTITSISNLF
jgi:hypothetical protein